MKTGIVGFGLSGRVFQAPFIQCHSGFQLEKIVSSKTIEVNLLYPQAEVVSSFEQLLNDDSLELIIIASPNATHFDYAKRALLAGKHVVVEKPFVTSLTQAQELVQLSKSSKRTLAVYQNRRWDGDFQTVKSIINQGILGEIVEYESHFDRYRPLANLDVWKQQNLPGSGVLFDLGPHLIDQALALFGMPEAVWANIQNQRQVGEVDDYFELQLFYPNMKAILKAGVLTRLTPPRFTIHGKAGSFVKYGLDPQENNLRNGMLPTHPEVGKDTENQYGTLSSNLNDIHFQGSIETLPGNYMGFFNNLYQHIKHGDPLEVTPTDALHAIEIIDKAQQSNREKRIVEMNQ
jgi:scyllo-inositol 2-dehydrogenase (NADP+)